MGAILDVARQDTRTEYLRLRARFSQKIVDYVVCDKQLAIVCLIELDDRTQRAERDQARDDMTSEAGYPTLRFQIRAKPSAPQIRTAVEALRSTGTAQMNERGA